MTRACGRVSFEKGGGRLANHPYPTAAPAHLVRSGREVGWGHFEHVTEGHLRRRPYGRQGGLDQAPEGRERGVIGGGVIGGG